MRLMSLRTRENGGLYAPHVPNIPRVGGVYRAVSLLIYPGWEGCTGLYMPPYTMVGRCTRLYMPPYTMVGILLWYIHPSYTTLGTPSSPLLPAMLYMLSPSAAQWPV